EDVLEGVRDLAGELSLQRRPLEGGGEIGADPCGKWHPADRVLPLRLGGTGRGLRRLDRFVLIAVHELLFARRVYSCGRLQSGGEWSTFCHASPLPYPAACLSGLRVDFLAQASGRISRNSASTSWAASRPRAPSCQTTAPWPGASA